MWIFAGGMVLGCILTVVFSKKESVVVAELTATRDFLKAKLTKIGEPFEGELNQVLRDLRLK